MWPASTLTLGGSVRVWKVWLTVTEHIQALHSVSFVCVWDKTLKIWDAVLVETVKILNPTKWTCQICQVYKLNMSNDCFKHSLDFFHVPIGTVPIETGKKEEMLLTSTFCLSPWILAGQISLLLWSQLVSVWHSLSMPEMRETPDIHHPPVAKLGNPWQCSVEHLLTLVENRVSSVRNCLQVIYFIITTSAIQCWPSLFGSLEIRHVAVSQPLESTSTLYIDIPTCERRTL